MESPGSGYFEFLLASQASRHAQGRRMSRASDASPWCRRTSDPEKPSQQVIIYRLRPLLLSPVAATWKQVKPP
jgi:hypothetical protein